MPSGDIIIPLKQSQTKPKDSCNTLNFQAFFPPIIKKPHCWAILITEASVVKVI